jgi:hypothetical protein
MTNHFDQMKAVLSIGRDVRVLHSSISDVYVTIRRSRSFMVRIMAALYLHG